MSDESVSQKKKKEELNEWGQPGAEPMAGIEKFTIAPVGSIKGSESLAQALVMQIERKLDEFGEGKPYARKEIEMHERMQIRQALSPNIEKDGSVSMQMGTMAQWQEIEEVSDALAGEIWDACSHDMALCLSVLDRFSLRISQDDFKPPELMSSLLVCVEEIRGEYPDKPKVGGNKPSHISFPIKFTIPSDGKPKAPLIEPVNIRLVSIREMLRRYFEKYPREYRLALAKVMGKNIADLQDVALLERLIEEEILKDGVWEFSLKVWNEVRKRIGEKGWAEPVDFGILPPLEKVGANEWKISPRWAGAQEKDEISIIARIIAEQMKDNK